MRRADRLFRIVQHLRGGRLTTAARLAETLEVSERTIYRDIVDLQASGVPIEGAAGVGYVLQGGFEIPPLMFTADEIVALVAGARLVRAWGGAAMARGAEEALIKIAAVLPEPERARAAAVQIHSMAPEMTDALRARIDALEAAVERRAVIEIGYSDAEGAATTRRLRPLGLWFWGKVWTLVAWCELRSDFRMFRLDRIEALQDTGERFRDERAKSLGEFFRQMEDWRHG
ncbi:YafY family protein [Tropicimonas sp. IMCC34043]|uniref:helix-turn-helix transcriptional regulator n=1 Tax=Tropicimonas sp. IMCC34043 TaxID=2248760 RepID=UPI000E2883CB|nr:YafY family protein [Tropicimonas sp. IMCC34043]